jgi:sulfur relay (sulfurtransferase) DsrF/TusC family protein
MGSVSILLRKPPYGTVDAPEAIRHALGGITEDLSINLVLVDGGVQSARKRQITDGTIYLSTEAGIQDCIDMGALVYVDKSALASEQLEAGDLIEGVVQASPEEIAKVLRESRTVMIF